VDINGVAVALGGAGITPVSGVNLVTHVHATAAVGTPSPPIGPP